MMLGCAPLSPKEYRLTLRNLRGRHKWRNRALLILGCCTGLRVSELCSLDCDIDLSRDELSVRGKGDKVRVVFLSDAAKKAVSS